jgi:hypothetical protein
MSQDAQCSSFCDAPHKISLNSLSAKHFASECGQGEIQPSHEVIDGLMSRDMMRAKQIDLKEGTCGRYWE